MYLKHMAAPGTLGPSIPLPAFYGGSPGADNYEQVWSDQRSMTTGFHTYGVMWDPQHVTFYFDGNVTGQLPTPPDMHQPMYLLADLAMQALSGVTKDPKHFDIDYIRAYSNDPNSKAVSLAPISSPDGVDTSNLHGATHALGGNPTTQSFSPETSGNHRLHCGVWIGTDRDRAQHFASVHHPSVHIWPADRCDAIPTIYAYQSLGVALASTAEHFQNTFGTSRYPASSSGDAQFVVDAYTSVFGHPGNAMEVQHFVEQLAHFENLYIDAGLFGNASNIELLARGAIYGQMLGIPHEIDQAGASITGITTTPPTAYRRAPGQACTFLNSYGRRRRLVARAEKWGQNIARYAMDSPPMSLMPLCFLALWGTCSVKVAQLADRCIHL